MKLNDSKIVIRPGKRYLIALFVYIYVAVIMLWSLVKVPCQRIQMERLE